jgi:hypothetical protein
MRLFQYWDTPTPPAEIAELIDECRDRNPEFEHVLLNEATAGDFIARHYGERERRAFRSCAVPAMQADVIRLCLMDALGGIYLDADIRCVRPLSELIERAPHALMTTLARSLNNSFLMFRQPHHAFIRCCLALALDNIESRHFKNVAIAVGPGIFNALRQIIDPSSAERTPSPEVLAGFQSAIGKILASSDSPVAPNWEVAMAWEPGLVELQKLARPLVASMPELISAYRSITIVDTSTTSQWMVAQQPAYKQTVRHWVNWTGDIYR